MYVFHMPLAVPIWNGLGVQAALPYCGLLLLGVMGMGELTERCTHSGARRRMNTGRQAVSSARPELVRWAFALP